VFFALHNFSLHKLTDCFEGSSSLQQKQERILRLIRREINLQIKKLKCVFMCKQFPCNFKKAYEWVKTTVIWLAWELFSWLPFLHVGCWWCLFQNSCYFSQTTRGRHF